MNIKCINIKWVINCAGTIKSRIEELGELNALKVNTIFPRILANICDKNNIKCQMCKNPKLCSIKKCYHVYFILLLGDNLLSLSRQSRFNA